MFLLVPQSYDYYNFFAIVLLYISQYKYIYSNKKNSVYIENRA